MNRSQRVTLAQETVQIIERGTYTSAGGRKLDISEAIQACHQSTIYYSPEEVRKLRQKVLVQQVPPTNPTAIEVVNETTLAGVAALLAQSPEPIAVLNFASAKNPGGGFLSGSQAQEESLARSSALYASLMQAWEFYERHRQSNSLLYSDAMILSPDCPVFRDDDGTLLDQPHQVTFITCPAPNAGAIAKNRPKEKPLILEVLQNRSELILALAAYHGYKRLVLGAWGCGVFKNNPQAVAEAFMTHLQQGLWKGRFDQVRFSVLDTSIDQNTFNCFANAIN